MSIISSAERLTSLRRPAMAARRGGPRISIVLAARSHGAWLTDAVDTLLPHCRRVAAELIVVRCDATPALPESESRLGIRIVMVPAESDLTQRRAAGLGAAAGDIVVLADEERGIPGAWWNLLASAGRSAAAD